jgi:hypothetical protein
MQMRLSERNRNPQERIAEKFIKSAFITYRNPTLENFGKRSQFWQAVGCYPDVIKDRLE